MLFTLTLLACLGCGLIAGVFFAFSSFVMKALARLPAAHGIAAMQSINVVVLNRWFLGVFMGTALLSAIAIVVALLQWQRTDAAWLLAGGVLYLAGCFLVTIACNVPRNEALAKCKPEDTDSIATWIQYVTGWTRWNHVRMVGSLAAALSFALALGA